MNPTPRHNFTVLILEDEPLVLKNIETRMGEALKGLCPPIPDIDADLKIPDWRGTPDLVATDNRADAATAIRDGRCDVLLADLVVKPDARAPRPNVECLPLLREIGRRQSCVSVVIHTAYEDRLDGATDIHIKYDTISKADPRSIYRLIEKGTSACTEVLTFRKTIGFAFMALRAGAGCTSPIDKQARLEKARRTFRGLTPPAWAPLHYSDALGTITHLLFRLTSIPSQSFGLKNLSEELVELLEPVMRGLCTSSFDFAGTAIPAFTKLEALGYPVLMRINDDGE